MVDIVILLILLLKIFGQKKLKPVQTLEIFFALKFLFLIKDGHKYFSDFSLYGLHAFNNQISN
jgi:hypothetical protein